MADHPFDNQQNPTVLSGKIVRTPAVEADDRQNLIVVDHRHGDLATDRFGDLQVKVTVIGRVQGVGKNHRFFAGGNHAGQTALLFRQFESADPDRRDILFQPGLAFCPDQLALGIFHRQPFLPLVFTDQGNTAGIGTDQLGSFGQDAA